jgi:hypothetical protein
MRINKGPKEFHEKGHSSLQAGNEGEKVRAKGGERREGGMGSKLWSGTTWESGIFIRV